MKLGLEDFPEGISFHVFRTITDPRLERQKHYSLEAILVITVCALLCDCDTFVDIADFAEDHEEWFKRFLELPDGTPSHDTIGRVLALINPVEFENIFFKWVQQTFKIQAGEVIAIDGKTMRGSQKKGVKGSGVHMVSAWASQAGIVLGQIPIAEKSNEITAIPKLIEMMDIKNCTVTIDAMGCQRGIVETIKKKGGEYCIAVKGNQKNLHEELQNLFTEDRCKVLEKSDTGQYVETVEKEHGRLEKRQYYSMSANEWISEDNLWLGTESVNLVVSERTVRGETSREKRFYISSHFPEAKINGDIIRRHWSIENNLHWSLDVTFHEDHIQTKIKNAVKNIGLVRKFALNLLKKEASFKGSLRRKRKKAGRDFGYLFKIILPLLI